LIEKHLIKSATTFEAKAFYLIIKGDYLKYISEYSKGDYKLKAVELAAAAYQTASEIIKEL
jgi:14-3-3 protein epsilon